MFFYIVSEMVEAMKLVAQLDVELTVEERNLLSVAYKNVIGARRASWRIVSSIEQKEESKSTEEKLSMIKNYRASVSNKAKDTIPYWMCLVILGNQNRGSFCECAQPMRDDVTM